MILEVCHRVNGCWVCRACNYKSKLKDHVFEHVEAQHINDGFAYFCPYCNEGKKARHHIRMHVITRHKGMSCSVRDLFYNISE